MLAHDHSPDVMLLQLHGPAPPTTAHGIAIAMHSHGPIHFSIIMISWFCSLK
jgi:hypothetical protein